MRDKLLDVKQASEILGLRPKTLYQWKWLKINLPFIKIGKSLRVSEEDLREFLNRRKIVPDETIRKTKEGL